MAAAIKIILGLFMLGGLAFSLYGCWEILGTISLVRSSPERARGVFIGYDRETVETRSASPSPTDPGRVDFENTTSVISYPVFAYTDRDGARSEVRGSKLHVIDHFRPGQEVEVILPRAGEPLLAGFSSLYLRDLCILAAGLCFLLVPAVIWRAALPALSSPAGQELQKRMAAQYEEIAASRVGRFTVKGIVKGTGIAVAVTVIAALGMAVAPFVRQMHLGFGMGLIDALEHRQYDRARALILKKKGIASRNEAGQTPLLLALEARQPDLARLLVDAGADVHARSRFDRTPLLTATLTGDLEMVRLLIASGASPDGPDEASSPVVQAILKGHDEIAAELIGSGCDLRRQYLSGDRRFTVGDLAVLVNKPALAELVRQRGGTFTATAPPR